MVRSNHLSLRFEQLTSFTRLNAYECKVPKTKRPAKETLRRYGVAQANTSPCDHFFIPPQDVLMSWKMQLQRAKDMAVGFYYIECEFGRYSIFTANGALQLHRAREIRKAVSQELDWLSESCRSPPNVSAVPSRVVLNTFRSKIHNHSYSAVLPEFGMTPEELSRLCCQRLLSGDHIRWVVKKLNTQQQEMFCVYPNSVLHFQGYVDRYLETHPLPKRIGVIFNVQKIRSVKNGIEIWETNVPSGFGNFGSHFSIAVFNIEENEVIYGDSLGWAPPKQLLPEIKKYYSALFKREMPEVIVRECHDSTSSGFGHKCAIDCSFRYPLQRDGNICGIVAVVMLSIACLSPQYFKQIVDVKRGNCRTEPRAFIANPTQFGKYLRQVVMAWYCEGRVDLRYLLSARALQIGSVHQGESQDNTDDAFDDDACNEEEDDDDDVVRVEFDFSGTSCDGKEDTGEKVTQKKDEVKGNDAAKHSLEQVFSFHL